MSGPASSRGRTLRVVLATHNAGKVGEFRALLAPEIMVDELSPTVGLPEETGSTFLENATLKARWVFEALGGTRGVLADDSGLEVQSLGGRPGIHSARYSDPGATDARNISRLLRELSDNADRRARFVCALVLFLPQSEGASSSAPADTPLSGGAPTMPRERDRTSPAAPLAISAVGHLVGSIATSPRGLRGFGYDPIFRPEGSALTVAEMEPRQKNALSHRAVAVRNLKQRLRELGLL